MNKKSSCDKSFCSATRELQCGSKILAGLIKGWWKIVKTGLTSDRYAIKNERVLAEITLMVDSNNYECITAVNTANEAWNALIDVHEKS